MSLIKIGKKYGKWVVIKKSKKLAASNATRLQYWYCKCDCGTKKAVMTASLLTNKSGCYDCSRLDLITHGDSGSPSKGIKPTRCYKTWIGIKSRTNVPSSQAYKWYGERGIKMYSKWISNYQAFKKYVTSLPNCPPEVFERPDGQKNRIKLSLDRIDNSKGYIPGNLRWVTTSQQNRNKSTTIYVNKKGKILSLAEYCEGKNVDRDLMYYYYVTRKYSLSKALKEVRHEKR